MKYISNVFRVEMLYILKNAYLSTRVPYIFERLSAIYIFIIYIYIIIYLIAFYQNLFKVSIL